MFGQKAVILLPSLDPAKLSRHEEDRRVLLAGIKLSRRLMNTEPLAPYFDYEGYPGVIFKMTMNCWMWRASEAQHFIILMGTCRMATATDPTAVVDDQLRVHGMQNLRVIDASIMPTMLSANLNAGVLMIAEKGADMVLGKPPL